MLIDFSVQNWRSIKDLQTISFVKGLGDELVSTNCFNVDQLKSPLLRSAAIYGPNAGGKSNLLKAIQALKNMVLLSDGWQHGDPIEVTPFLLDEESKSQPTLFEINFVAQKIRYQYSVTANNSRIIDERLYAFPNGRAQTWIGRSWQAEKNSYKWEKCEELKAKASQKSLWQDSTRENVLFLSNAVKFNCEQLKPAFDWFRQTLRINLGGIWSHSMTAQKYSAGNTAEILQFIKAADLGIDGFKVEAEKFSPELLPADLPFEFKDSFLEMMKDEVRYSVQTIHQKANGENVVFDLEDESDGTKKIFGLAGPWLEALHKGHVLIVDELQDNLHPKLLEFLVNLFHNPALNKYGAQLLFALHDTAILNQEILRRDQIWLCEKNNKQSSVLTPLTDFKVIKGRENIEVNYLAGRYGAIPITKNLSFSKQ